MNKLKIELTNQPHFTIESEKIKCSEKYLTKDI